MSNLFIPKKIRVGYQNREGTFSGRLAYVIYYDTKGKLRKEHSWENWRDKKIDPEEYNNEPTEGFIINKEARRYNWSHFGSDRSYIRIYDPRGVEMEITPDNLIGLLMETDCNKRMFDGKFVYAWCGKDLVLLPCDSEAYKEALEHTARQSKKVSARDLKEGCSYTLKNGKEVIYMGRFPWYTWSYEKGRTNKKQHIFNLDHEWRNEKVFKPIQSITTRLSHLNSPEPVQEYANLVDELKKNPQTQNIIDWEFTSSPITELGIKEVGTRKEMEGKIVLKRIAPNKLQKFNLLLIHNSYYLKKEPANLKISKQYILDTKTCCRSVPEKTKIGGWYYHQFPEELVTEQEAIEFLKDCVKVNAILESGQKIPVRDLEKYGNPIFKD